jgi:hypothetical protein
MVFDLILLHLHEHKLKKKIQQQLGLSSEHYDKISNHLLKKIYKRLAGESIIDHLAYLNRKNFYPLLFHEIRYLLRTIPTQALSQQEQEMHYYALYNLALNVPALYYDERLIKKITTAYLACINSQQMEKEFELKTKIQFVKLNRSMQGAPDDKESASILQNLQNLEKKFRSVKSASHKNILYRVYLTYYSYLQPDREMQQAYLKKIESLYPDFKLPTFEKALNQCTLAEIMISQNEYTAAFHLYKIVCDYYKGVLSNQYHHFAQFIELAIILRKTREAMELIDRYFSRHVMTRNQPYGVLGAILLAQFYLHQQDYKAAFHYISLGKSLNTPRLYFHFDLKLRQLENLFFALTGDLNFAQILAQKNIRFVHVNKLKLNQNPNAQVFQLLRDVKKNLVRRDEKMPDKFAEIMRNLDTGLLKIWHQPLQNVLAMYFPPQKQGMRTASFN